MDAGIAFVLIFQTMLTEIAVVIVRCDRRFGECFISNIKTYRVINAHLSPSQHQRSTLVIKLPTSLPTHRRRCRWRCMLLSGRIGCLLVALSLTVPRISSCAVARGLSSAHRQLGPFRHVRYSGQSPLEPCAHFPTTHCCDLSWLACSPRRREQYNSTAYLSIFLAKSHNTS